MRREWTPKELGKILGLSKRGINKRAKKEGWKFQKGKNHRGGGAKFIYSTEDLPEDVQAAIVRSGEPVTTIEMDLLKGEARLEAHKRRFPANEFMLSPEAVRRELTDPQGSLPYNDIPTLAPEPWAITLDVLHDDRVGDLAQIVREIEEIPMGMSKTGAMNAIAIKYGLNRSTLYRYARKHANAGLAGLKHRKSTRGQPRTWTPEAIDLWIGLCLKRENRDIGKDEIYECLRYEAAKRDWRVGSYSSALWWFNKRVTPQLLALQRGGMRALDNTLPPICRDYSDLKPFEILVGDQHRFDRWVMDDDTGRVFRPEGYFWQDLRTRCFYGGALAERYDSQLMGLALRIGMRRFGAFGSIYTDHGKPEESRYIMGILREMRMLGLGAEGTLDVPADLSGADPEEAMCRMMLPGDHRQAIVRNAKAKMIEGTFSQLENILRSKMRLPGGTKDLGAPQEEREVDEKEAEKLARSGKLLTFREFVLAVFRAMDFYNNEKPHRGVLREWAWDPKPKSATPKQCLMACYDEDGWRPRRLPEDAVEMVFLARERRARVVDRGRISFRKEKFEHPALMSLHGQRVGIRYDPLDPSWIMVVHRDEILCRAEPVEYSSMKDRKLAARKIAEKNERKRAFREEYLALTAPAPDLREYSTVPLAEKAAAIVGKAKREAQKRAAEEAEIARVRTPEELEAEIRQITEYVPEPVRPIPTTEHERYGYLLDRMAAGAEVSEEDQAWAEAYEEKVNADADTRRYWSIYKDVIGLKRGT